MTLATNYVLYDEPCCPSVMFSVAAAAACIVHLYPDFPCFWPLPLFFFSLDTAA